MARRARARRRQRDTARALSGGGAPTAELGFGGPSATSWWGSVEESTPELQWPSSVTTYARMRRTDTQVSSVLRAVKMPIQRVNWRIAPNGARPEVVQQIAEDLGLPIDGAEPAPAARVRDRFSWADYVRLSLLSLDFGHMAFEQVCRVDERGRIRLRKLAPRMPGTIREWDIAPDGGLRSIVQNPPVGLKMPAGAKPMEAARIPVERLVVHVNEREGGDWLGNSLLRPAYKFWVLKDRMLRVGAQTVERNGMGVPIYTGAPRENDLSTGLAIARSVRAGDSSGAALRNGADLKLKGVEGDLPDAEKWVRYYDEQMARTALLHFLNLGTQTGSWALGSTFAEFFTMSLQATADAFQAVTNAHVIEDLVDWNWGSDEIAPLLVCDEIGARHPATAEAIKTLTDAGVVLPDRDLEEFARQLHGLPPKGNYSAPARPAPAPGGQNPTAAALRALAAQLETEETAS